MRLLVVENVGRTSLFSSFTDWNSSKRGKRRLVGCLAAGNTRSLLLRIVHKFTGLWRRSLSLVEDIRLREYPLE